MTVITESAIEAARRRIGALEVVIESVSTSTYSITPRPEFTRTTTLLTLHGGGHSGSGEDVCYDGALQALLGDWYPTLDLCGSWTMSTLSAHIAEHLTRPAHPEGGSWTDHPNFHRWTIESAALDLALRQAGMTFPQVCGVEAQPLHFCVSMGLGSPPDASRVTDWLAAVPNLQFKLDSSNEWTDQLVSDLAATGAVRVIDIKGLYSGDWIDNTPDPALYARLATLLPADVLLEDANLTPEVVDALGEQALNRLTWDYALHAPTDLDSIERRPAAINIKPSRFGAIDAVLEVVSWCAQRDIPCYAGGQFELGIGRQHGQLLASCFYPDSANDIAPVDWHLAKPGDAVPTSPMDLSPGVGFRIATAT